MKRASLIMGIISICGMVIGFFPCFGSLNWINIPFSGVGLIIGIIAYNQEDGEPKGNAKTGIILCAIAVFLGLFRLLIGGGVV